MATFSKDTVFNIIGGTNPLLSSVGEANTVFGNRSSLSAKRGKNRTGYTYNVVTGTSSTVESEDILYSLIAGYNSGNSTVSAVALIVQGVSAGSGMSNVRDSTLFGVESGANHRNAKNNIFFGCEAGSNSSPFSGNSCNIGIGYRTFTDASLNKWNIALGTESLYSTENVEDSIFIGNMLSDMSNVSYSVTLGNKTGRLFQGSNLLLVGHNISCISEVPLYINNLVAIGNSLSISSNYSNRILIGTGDNHMFTTGNTYPYPSELNRDIIAFGRTRPLFSFSDTSEPPSLILNGPVTQPTVGRMVLSSDHVIPDKPVVFFARSFPNRRVFVGSHISADSLNNYGTNQLYNSEQLLINLTPNRIGICGTFLYEGDNLSKTFTTDFITRYSIHKYKQSFVYNPQGYTPQQIQMSFMSNPNFGRELEKIIYIRPKPTPRASLSVTIVFKGGVASNSVGPMPFQLPTMPSIGDTYVNYVDASANNKNIFYTYLGGPSWFEQEWSTFRRTDTYDTLSFERVNVPPDPTSVYITRDTSELYVSAVNPSTGQVFWAATTISEVLTTSDADALMAGTISAPCGALALYNVPPGDGYTHWIQISQTGISWIPLARFSEGPEEFPPADVSGGFRDQVDLFDILPEEKYKSYDVFAAGANTILYTDASFSSWSSLSFSSNVVSPIYNIIPTGNLSL
jgi:hypothetical protein